MLEETRKILAESKLAPDPKARRAYIKRAVLERREQAKRRRQRPFHTYGDEFRAAFKKPPEEADRVVTELEAILEDTATHGPAAGHKRRARKSVSTRANAAAAAASAGQSKLVWFGTEKSLCEWFRWLFDSPANTDVNRHFIREGKDVSECLPDPPELQSKFPTKHLAYVLSKTVELRLIQDTGNMHVILARLCLDQHGKLLDPARIGKHGPKTVPKRKRDILDKTLMAIAK